MTTRNGNFLERLERFYNRHADKMSAALRGAGFAGEEIVRLRLSLNKQAILEASEVPADQLQRSISEAVDGWEGQAADLWERITQTEDE